MRFVITGEWSRNRLLQTIVTLYSFYVAALWVTNALLFHDDMPCTPTREAMHARESESADANPTLGGDAPAGEVTPPHDPRQTCRAR